MSHDTRIYTVCAKMCVYAYAFQHELLGHIRVRNCMRECMCESLLMCVNANTCVCVCTCVFKVEERSRHLLK